MNWEERLSRWADRLEVAGDKTVDFASAEIPEYVRELLAWEFWSSIFVVGVMIALFFVCVVAMKFICKALDKVKWDPEDNFLAALLFLCCCIGMPTCVIVGTVQSYNAVKVKVAPRVVIVEKIQGLARGHK
jgi:O-antigen/teichoic acid export membrane protein